MMKFILFINIICRLCSIKFLNTLGCPSGIYSTYILDILVTNIGYATIELNRKGRTVFLYIVVFVRPIPLYKRIKSKKENIM
jgi:hypothetical protein